MKQRSLEFAAFVTVGIKCFSRGMNSRGLPFFHEPLYEWPRRDGDDDDDAARGKGLRKSWPPLGGPQPRKGRFNLKDIALYSSKDTVTLD